MVWGAVIGGAAAIAGTVGSSLLGANSAKKAAKYQLQATREGIAEQRRQFDITDQQLAPYRNVGPNALAAYEGLTDPTAQMEYLQNHPLYEYLNKRAADRATDRMIAGGKSYSGQGLQAAQQGMYDLSEGLITNALNRYGGLVDTGLTAATRGAAFREGLANNVTNLLGQGANARAAGVIGANNAYATGINELAKMAGAYFGQVGGKPKTTSSTPSAGVQLGNYFQTYGYGQP